MGILGPHKYSVPADVMAPASGGQQRWKLAERGGGAESSSAHEGPARSARMEPYGFRRPPTLENPFQPRLRERSASTPRSSREEGGDVLPEVPGLLGRPGRGEREVVSGEQTEAANVPGRKKTNEGAGGGAEGLGGGV